MSGHHDEVMETKKATGRWEVGSQEADCEVRKGPSLFHACQLLSQPPFCPGPSLAPLPGSRRLWLCQAPACPQSPLQCGCCCSARSRDHYSGHTLSPESRLCSCTGSVRLWRNPRSKMTLLKISRCWHQSIKPSRGAFLAWSPKWLYRLGGKKLALEGTPRALEMHMT